MRIDSRILVAVLGLCVAFAVGAQQPPYTRLEQPQPTAAEGQRVEVLEFFSYACPHCNRFEPLLSDWTASHEEQAKVIHVPVTFGRDSWALYAQAFYVAEALGVLDKTHKALFNAIHAEGRRFTSAEGIADFYASLGVDREAALNAFDSFSVSMKMRRAKRMARDYGIRSTPSLAVAGRYLITVEQAGGQRGMLEAASTLVQQQSGG